MEAGHSAQEAQRGLLGATRVFCVPYPARRPYIKTLNSGHYGPFQRDLAIHVEVWHAWFSCVPKTGLRDESR
jgi:hypothetical protein